MNAVLYNEDCSIYAVLFGGNEGSLRHDASLMGKPCILTEAAINKDTYYVSDGEIVEIPEKPVGANVFDYQNGEWRFDLTEEKTRKWFEIKTAREFEEFGLFTWNNYNFDADERSQQRILTATQRAVSDSSVSIMWTLSDNTVVTFNATELIQIGQALASHIDNCHTKARIKRAEITSATTFSELNNISW
jgi:hypothetical protein